MAYIDVILIVILSGFVSYGLFFGLIRSLGVLVGVIVGAILASRFYLIAFNFVEPIFFGFGNLGKVLIFVILFSLINRVVGLGFYFLEKVFNVISIIPFLKTINRLAGAILGFFAGGLSIGLVLYVISKYTLLDYFIGRWLVDSSLTPMFLKFNDLLLPLLPEMLKALKSLI